MPGARVPGGDGPRTGRWSCARPARPARRTPTRRRPSRTRPVWSSSEIDPALNNSASPWTASTCGRYAPRYFLVNGRAVRRRRAVHRRDGRQHARSLRYLNAGIQHHSLGVLGLHQRVIAADGSQLPAPRTMVAETIAPGQTADVLVTRPGDGRGLHDVPGLRRRAGAQQQQRRTASAACSPSSTPVGTAGGIDTVGPITIAASRSRVAPGSGLSRSPRRERRGTGERRRPGGRVPRRRAPARPSDRALRWRARSSPATEAVSATIPAGSTPRAWTAGTHTRLRPRPGRRSATGARTPRRPSRSTGPGPRRAPSRSPRTRRTDRSVALGGTASDVASGNGNVVAAEYFIGAPGANGTGSIVTRNVTAPTVSLTATIHGSRRERRRLRPRPGCRRQLGSATPRST